MARGVALFLVGSLVLVALLGCGRWFEQREPWRHDAEVECLRSGAVREGPGVTLLSPIEGPGICGADFPLKLSVLGAGSALGFVDEVRPSAAIPGSATPPAYPREFVIRPPYAPAPVQAPGPLPLGPNYSDGGAAQAPAVTPYDPGASLAPRQDPMLPVASAAGVAPPATLACPIVSALDSWVRDAVQPAAQRWFGQTVVEIKQISAYSCRSMNGQRGAPISEHAFGNAFDVAAFTLADGYKVTVKDGWRGAPAERGFLHDVQAAACRQFSTVLAPGSNAFHYDHIHVDLARHGSGRAICNPAAIPGEVAAGRAPDPAFTGSVRADRVERTRPYHAIAGED